MRLVKTLVYSAMLLIMVTGIGWVTARITDKPDLMLWFGTWLIRSLYVAGIALGIALVTGIYHLYLYLFTDRRPLGFFETTRKDAP